MDKDKSVIGGPDRMRAGPVWGEQRPDPDAMFHVDLPKGGKDVPVGEPLGAGQRAAVLSYSPEYLGDSPARGFTGPFNLLGGPLDILAQMSLPQLPKLAACDFYAPLFLFDRLEFSRTEGVERRDPSNAALAEEKLLVPIAVTAKDYWDNSTIRRDGFDIWQVRDREEPGMWSMWYTPVMDPVPPEESVPDLAFKLQLQDCLILPDPAVPLEDVLVFRSRRRPELMALRHHMDELAIRASQEGHQILSNRITIEKFQSAVNDYVRIAKEPNWKKFVGSLEWEMNWSKGVVAGAMAGLAAAPTGLSAPIAVGAAILGSLSIKSTRGIKSADAKNPFAYLVHSIKEFPG